MKKKTLAGYIIGLFWIGLAGIANATVIDFNNATVGQYTHYEEAGYQIDSLVGFLSIVDNGGLKYGTLLPGWSVQLTAIDGSKFDFTSFLIPPAVGGGNVENSVTITSNEGGSFDAIIAQTYSFSGGLWSNLDWLTFNIGPVGLFAKFDDITVNSVDPVPEPATMLLLGTGLVGVAGAARRRKKNQA